MTNAMCSVDRVKKRNGTSFHQKLRLFLLRKKVERVLLDSRFDNINESQVAFCKAVNLLVSSCLVLCSNKVKNHKNTSLARAINSGTSFDTKCLAGQV